MIDPEINKILKKNQALLEDLEKRVKKIQNRLMWQTIGGILKIVLIVGPIVFGVIYISPYVSGYFKTLKPVFQALHLAPYEEVLDSEGLETGDKASQQIVDSFCDEEVRDFMIDQYCPKQ